MYGFQRVFDDQLAVSCDLCHRPATIREKWLWPEKAMLEIVGRL